jgi:hypothetical protein
MAIQQAKKKKTPRKAKEPPKKPVGISKAQGKKNAMASNFALYGLLMIMTAKKIGWRRSRLAAFLIMGEGDAFTIPACRDYFNCVSKDYFKFVTAALVKKGLVVRNGKAKQGRILYTLSPSGRDFYKKVHRAMMNYCQEHYKNHKSKSRI